MPITNANTRQKLLEDTQSLRERVAMKAGVLADNLSGFMDPVAYEPHVLKDRSVKPEDDLAELERRINSLEMLLGRIGG